MADESEESLVDRFVSVTGASEDEANVLLTACNQNLELAISMYLDGSDHQNSVNPSNDNSCVRAPIPQKTEVLVQEPMRRPVFMNRRRKVGSVFDSFRDFQAESMEQENGPSTSRGPEKHSLQQLFRPPFDLIQKGTFQMVKEKGNACDKWLLVNIQNAQEFSCQMLNRDVWSDFIIKELVKKYFFLWQIYSDSEEGQRYVRYYPVTTWPSVAVLDPRTGEKCVEWHTTDTESFRSLLREFIKENPSPSDSNMNGPVTKKRKVMSLAEMSEEKQLEAAMAESLQIKSSTDITVIDDSDSETDEYNTDSDSDIQEIGHTVAASKEKPHVIWSDSENSADTIDGSLQSSSSDLPSDIKVVTDSSSCSSSKLQNGSTTSWKEFLGQSSDPLFHLLIRLPDGQRKPLDVPSSTQLMAILLYVEEQGCSRQTHELVTHFPLKNLSILPTSQTLQSIGLNPRETIYVQEQ